MANILITGAAGYIGSVLVGKLLGQGYNIIALDNLMYGQTSLFQYCSIPRFTFVRGDIRDQLLIKSLLERTDVYVPLAAIVGAQACTINPQAASINLAVQGHTGALKHHLVIYPTTNSGYGTQSRDFYCTETTLLEPISEYGKQKVIIEKLLLENVPNIISLRLATVFGPSARMRLDLLVNYFTYKAMMDGYIVIYEPEFKRNYIHIEDVTDCIIHCIKNHKSMVGEVYNAGLYNGNYSKLELAGIITGIIGENLGKDCNILIGPGNDPDRRNYVVSNDKLVTAGFKAERSVELGIGQLIKLYQMMPMDRFRNI